MLRLAGRNRQHASQPLDRSQRSFQVVHQRLHLTQGSVFQRLQPQLAIQTTLLGDSQISGIDAEQLGQNEGIGRADKKQRQTGDIQQVFKLKKFGDFFQIGRNFAATETISAEHRNDVQPFHAEQQQAKHQNLVQHFTGHVFQPGHQQDCQNQADCRNS